MIGGGGEVLDGDRTAVRLTRVAPFLEGDPESRIATTFGAQAQAVNESRTYNWAVKAYAICAPLSSLPGYVVKNGFAFGSNGFAAAGAVCPSGTVAYGSGAFVTARQGRVFLQLNRTGRNNDLSRATARAVPGFAWDGGVNTMVMCARPQGEIQFDGAGSLVMEVSDRCASGFRTHGIGGGGSPHTDGGPAWLDKIAPHPDLRGVDVSLTAPLDPAIGGMIAHQRCAR